MSKSRVKCPFCGSKNTARIQYGYPLFSEELQQQLDEGSVKLGGCVINTVVVNGEHIQTDPGMYCNDCKKNFAKPPLIISKDRSSAEDYRDIVEFVRFRVGGYFSGTHEVKISKNESGALVEVDAFPVFDPDEIKEREKLITEKEWNKILDSLYDRLFLHEWKKKYDDPDILDGTQWELEIKLTKGRKRSYYGSNMYPPYWENLKRLFRPYVKM